MRLGVVILAAGLGKRMRSALPKVLHPLAGKPLLAHVLDTAKAVGAERIVTVYGHGGDQVLTALADSGCLWVEQAEQLGTGHAVIQAMPQVAEMDRVLILYGDVPLISAETLTRLLQVAAETDLGILTADVPIPPDTGGSCATPRSGSSGSSRKRMRRPNSAPSTRSTQAFWSPTDRGWTVGSPASATTMFRANIISPTSPRWPRPRASRLHPPGPDDSRRSQASTTGFSSRPSSAIISAMPRKT